jgi:hypothetical protein
VSARIAGIAVVLLLAFTGSAFAAQEEPTAAQTPAAGTTEQESSAVEATDGSEDPSAEEKGESGKGSDGIAVAIVVLGLCALGFAYLFYDRWRGSYEALATSVLNKTNHLPVIVFNPVEDAQFRQRTITAEAAQKQPVVTGPAAVVVGEKTVYKASVEGGSADSITWTVAPADAATVDPASGPEVTVTAAKEGPFTLSVQGVEGAPTEAHVTAVAKTAEGGVPLMGAGFAGVAATIIAFTIAGALTALEILGADAFIAFLGPVVGYFFAQAKDASQSGGSTT